MNKPLLIGLTGFAGAGKDTVAAILDDFNSFWQVAFADALRSEVREAFGIHAPDWPSREIKEQPQERLSLANAPDAFAFTVVRALLRAVKRGDDVPGDDWMHAPRSPRQILQWWGTEYRRAQNPDYWIDHMARHLASNEPRLVFYGDPGTVITDVRFDNERDFIRQRGGVIWQVVRPGHHGQTEGAHASATGGTEFAPDAVIDNSGDLHDLRRTVVATLEALYAQRATPPLPNQPQPETPQ